MSDRRAEDEGDASKLRHALKVVSTKLAELSAIDLDSAGAAAAMRLDDAAKEAVRSGRPTLATNLGTKLAVELDKLFDTVLLQSQVLEVGLRQAAAMKQDPTTVQLPTFMLDYLRQNLATWAILVDIAEEQLSRAPQAAAAAAAGAATTPAQATNVKRASVNDSTKTSPASIAPRTAGSATVQQPFTNYWQVIYHEMFPQELVPRAKRQAKDRLFPRLWLAMRPVGKKSSPLQMWHDIAHVCLPGQQFATPNAARTAVRAWAIAQLPAGCQSRVAVETSPSSGTTKSYASALINGTPSPKTKAKLAQSRLDTTLAHYQRVSSWLYADAPQHESIKDAHGFLLARAKQELQVDGDWDVSTAVLWRHVYEKLFPRRPPPQAGLKIVKSMIREWQQPNHASPHHHAPATPTSMRKPAGRPAPSHRELPTDNVHTNGRGGGESETETDASWYSSASGEAESESDESDADADDDERRHENDVQDDDSEAASDLGTATSSDDTSASAVLTPYDTPTRVRHAPRYRAPQSAQLQLNSADAAGEELPDRLIFRRLMPGKKEPLYDAHVRSALKACFVDARDYIDAVDRLRRAERAGTHGDAYEKLERELMAKIPRYKDAEQLKQAVRSDRRGALSVATARAFGVTGLLRTLQFSS